MGPMTRKVLDTTELIRTWRTRWARSRGEKTLEDVKRWAAYLIAFSKTSAIVSPTYVEFIGGVVNKEQMRLATVFLDLFEVLDGGRTLPEDWREAIRLAKRVPRDAKPRHLGDCLIRAIAIRLRCEVMTKDQGFPK